MSQSSGRSFGNVSIFRNKDGGDRYQGILTKVGSQRFEAARALLGALVGRPTKKVSDADTIEFLARGKAATEAYLAENPL